MSLNDALFRKDLNHVTLRAHVPTTHTLI